MSFSTRTMRLADWKKLRHFTAKEFHHPEMMGYEFMLWLDNVREAAGVKMVRTSDYRSKEYNASLPNSATDSAHSDIPCNSIDIGKRPTKDDPNWNRSRFQIVKAAMDNGCVRIGTYADGSLHLDMTHDRRPAPRMWLVGRT